MFKVFARYYWGKGFNFGITQVILIQLSQLRVVLFMRYLGTPVHIAKSGHLIVRIRSREMPPLESPVLTSYMKVIGRIIDIIGPVNEPYAVVKLTKTLTTERLPSPLYYQPKRPRRKIRKRR